jgi:hypothetical protein
VWKLFEGELAFFSRDPVAPQVAFVLAFVDSRGCQEKVQCRVYIFAHQKALFGLMYIHLDILL